MMRARRIIAWVPVVAALFACPQATLRSHAAEHADAAFSAALVSREHTYRVDVRVRPFLFWLRKTDVGDGRITWRTGPGATVGYELLVGSDPARTPRRINRWGYLREESGPRGATVFGVMSKSDEQSVGDADRRTASSGGAHVFKALRQHVIGSQAEIVVSDVDVETDLTYSDLGALLASVPGAPTKRRTAAVAGWTSPGFLAAAASLIEHARTTTAPAHAVRIYPYNGRLYELQLLSTERLDPFTHQGQSFGHAVRSQFRVHNRTTGQDSPFTVVHGVQGHLTDVPLLISFRPRWWMEIECVIGDRAGTIPGSPLSARR